VGRVVCGGGGGGGGGVVAAVAAGGSPQNRYPVALVIIIIITYYMSGVVVVEIFKQTLTLLCSLSTKQTKVKFCLNWTKGRWFHIGQRFFGRR
jgi:hypothetical protein